MKQQPCLNLRHFFEIFQSDKMALIRSKIGFLGASTIISLPFFQWQEFLTSFQSRQHAPILVKSVMLCQRFYHQQFCSGQSFEMKRNIRKPSTSIFPYIYFLLKSVCICDMFHVLYNLNIHMSKKKHSYACNTSLYFLQSINAIFIAKLQQLGNNL